jgi:subtilase family serine protease
MTATSEPRTLKVMVDYYNDVVESNENNNENTVKLLTSLADLVVKDMTWTPNDAGIGDDVTFTVTVKNEGSGRAEASRGAFNVGGNYWGYVDIEALEPGQETTADFTWVADYGQLTVNFAADFDNKITEIDEVNNYITKTVPIVLPDLRISGIDWSPINPALGDTVTFTVTLVNQSGGKADNCQLGYYIDDVLLASDSIYPLEPYQTITRTCTWQAQNGRHTFSAMADASRRVTESDENNNESSVLVVPYMADLTVGPITWSPFEMPPGSEVDFSVEIENTGSLRSGLFRVTCFVDDAIIGDVRIENLEAGESVTGTFPWSATAGFHVLNVVADSGNQVIEIDESNNSKNVNLPPPDLIVQGITWSPDNASIGDNVTFTATVFNQGQSKSQATQLSFYVDGVLKETADLPEIAQSGSTKVKFEWTAQSGKHTIRSVADPADRVTETDETNNDIQLDFATLTPDLTVSSINWAIENALIDTSTNITITVDNPGTDTAGVSVLRCFIDNQPPKDVEIGPIPAGGTATATISVPLEAGAHEMYAVADADHEVTELNEYNNQTNLSFNTIAPDLVVKSITLTPAESVPGEEVTVTVNVENRGRDTAQNVRVALSVNGSPLGDADIDEIAVGDIKPATFTWTSLEGMQEFQALADSEGTVAESNENNNTKSRTVTVTAPIVTATTHKAAAVSASGGILDSWWWVILVAGLLLGGAFFYSTFKAIRRNQ